MQIRAIDVDDHAQFHDFYVAMRDSLLVERPHAPVWSELETQLTLRIPELTETWTAFGAYDDEGHLRGAAMFVLPLLDNIDKAYFEVHVAPKDRRRGVGSALVGHVTDVAREHGRTVLLVESNVPAGERETHAHVRFAEKHGFSAASVEVRRELQLPVGDAQLATWQREAAPFHLDYRIETFVDDLPDAFLPSLCYLLNQLAVDAPTGDIDFEAEGMTPQALLIYQAKLKAQGRTVFETLAIDPAGQAVAQTTLVVSSDVPDVVLQWQTLVHKAHRGHRLGMAVKARNLQAMQQAFPDCKRVSTTNSEENVNILAINVTMGFEPVELLVEFQRKL